MNEQMKYQLATAAAIWAAWFTFLALAMEW